jgi:hypothetical protein
MISEETIMEFQKALQEEYGKDVSFPEASEILFDLVTYFDLLAKMSNEMTRAP